MSSCSDTACEQEQAVEPAMVELAYALDLPLVATNDVHFLEARSYEAHDALICIAEGAQIGAGPTAAG